MDAVRSIAVAAITLLATGCTPLLESPSVEAVRAARASAPQRVETMKPILAPLDENVVDVPRSAAGSLAQIGPAAIPALKEALRDADPKVRRQAARAIGKMGPDAETAVAELIAALDDEDPGVRESAAQALGKIGPQAAPAIPALIKALEEPTPSAPTTSDAEEIPPPADATK